MLSRTVETPNAVLCVTVNPDTNMVDISAAPTGYPVYQSPAASLTLRGDDFSVRKARYFIRGESDGQDLAESLSTYRRLCSDWFWSVVEGSK